MLENLRQLSQSRILFTLDERGKPVRCLSPEEWIQWMLHATFDSVRSVIDHKRELLTTFMGYCGEHRESQPLTFATVFKPEPNLPEFNVPLEWYRTWDEARDGHQLHVRRFSLKTIRQSKLLRR